MHGSNVNEQREGSAQEQPGGDHPARAPAGEEAPQGEVEPQDDGGEASENNVLLVKVRRLEAELERYRAHAERTSKLFLAATDYAAWVHERARSDAELALRKARARAEKLMATTRELEQTELELARQQAELERLEALTDETRTRLSAFLTTGLELLTDESKAEPPSRPNSRQDNLQDTLHEQLSTTAPGHDSEIETPERHQSPSDHLTR